MDYVTYGLTLIICLLLFVIGLISCIALWLFDQLGRKAELISDFAQNEESQIMAHWHYPGAQAYGIKAGRRKVLVRAAEPFTVMIGFDLVMPGWYLLVMSWLWWTTVAKLRGSEARSFFDPTGCARAVPDHRGHGYVAVFSTVMGKSPFDYRVITDRPIAASISAQDDVQHYDVTHYVPSHLYVWLFGWYN